MLWACSPSSLFRDNKKGLVDEGHLASVARQVASSQNIPVQSVKVDTARALALADTLSQKSDSLLAVADSVVATLSGDSAAVATTQATPGDDPLLPDTAAMDSLQLAIWKHNKAIDDSLRADSLNRRRKNGIDSPVEFSAQDSLVYVAGTSMAHLYGDSHVKYQNMDLKSEKIYVCLDSSLVHATGARDTASHQLIGTPVLRWTMMCMRATRWLSTSRPRWD
jgi:hypothetical protein